MTVCLLLLVIPVAAAGRSVYSVAEVQRLLDLGDSEAAIKLLDSRLRKQPTDAEALLLRSTAHLMTGNLELGRRDLEACVTFDPNTRQAWLNLAAFDLAQTDYDGALEAFTRAEALDPDAPDNSLNIGAVLLLRGDREQASERFRRYLSVNSDDANAFYLVATNYAIAGRGDLAVALLRRAIQIDEHTRLRARTDTNFSALVDDSGFQNLLTTDEYRPPPNAPSAQRSFDIPYTGRDSRVLAATLNALQIARLPVASGVEVTPLWTLVWSDVRIKIAANEKSGTDVLITADPGSFTPPEWSAKTDDLFRRIALQLHALRPKIDLERGQ
ncbi:MAG: tetratricopeptide repeat protein [Acidobacteriota bacterium]|nr:tetratricopeptide repeat protein [Acidobacteriota bacterium]